MLGLDYVRTARAKGLRERSVILRHAARNALLPVVTIIGLPARRPAVGRGPDRDDLQPDRVGRSLFEAITGRDYVVIQGFTLSSRSTYVMINLIVDISYGFLDPRIRP